MKHLAGLIAMALLGASAPVEAAPPVQFLCTVNGAGMLKPKIASEEICARFKLGIEAVINIPMQRVALLPKVSARSLRLIKIDVIIRNPAIVAATATQHYHAKTRAYSETSISVSDRPLDMANIDQLAREVARMIKL
jgi:hypothetical protein